MPPRQHYRRVEYKVDLTREGKILEDRIKQDGVDVMKFDEPISDVLYTTQGVKEPNQPKKGYTQARWDEHRREGADYRVIHPGRLLPFAFLNRVKVGDKELAELVGGEGIDIRAFMLVRDALNPTDIVPVLRIWKEYEKNKFEPQYYRVGDEERKIFPNKFNSTGPLEIALRNTKDSPHPATEIYLYETFENVRIVKCGDRIISSVYYHPYFASCSYFDSYLNAFRGKSDITKKTNVEELKEDQFWTDADAKSPVPVEEEKKEQKEPAKNKRKADAMKEKEKKEKTKKKKAAKSGSETEESEGPKRKRQKADDTESDSDEDPKSDGDGDVKDDARDKNYKAEDDDDDEEDDDSDGDDTEDSGEDIRSKRRDRRSKKKKNPKEKAKPKAEAKPKGKRASKGKAAKKTPAGRGKKRGKANGVLPLVSAAEPLEPATRATRAPMPPINPDDTKLAERIWNVAVGEKEGFLYKDGPSEAAVRGAMLMMSAIVQTMPSRRAADIISDADRREYSTFYAVACAYAKEKKLIGPEDLTAEHVELLSKLFNIDPPAGSLRTLGLVALFAPAVLSISPSPHVQADSDALKTAWKNILPNPDRLERMDKLLVKLGVTGDARPDWLRAQLPPPKQTTSSSSSEQKSADQLSAEYKDRIKALAHGKHASPAANGVAHVDKKEAEPSPSPTTREAASVMVAIAKEKAAKAKKEEEEEAAKAAAAAAPPVTPPPPANSEKVPTTPPPRTRRLSKGGIGSPEAPRPPRARIVKVSDDVPTAPPPPPTEPAPVMESIPEAAPLQQPTPSPEPAKEKEPEPQAEPSPPPKEENTEMTQAESTAADAETNGDKPADAGVLSSSFRSDSQPMESEAVEATEAPATAAAAPTVSDSQPPSADAMDYDSV